MGYRKESYAKNREYYLEKNRKRKQELREKLTNYKRSLTCADCGYDFKDHPECCDFHHIDESTKKI